MRLTTCWLYLVAELLLTHPMQAQTPPHQTLDQVKDLPACDCSARDRPRAFSEQETAAPTDFPSPRKAREEVEKMLKIVKTNSAIEFEGRIEVLEAGCMSPMAWTCPDAQEGQQRVILYNNSFLRYITTKQGVATPIDRHVLAHEVGHHVLGHVRSVRVMGRLRGSFERDTPGRQGIFKRFNIANDQASELAADFFGLWLLAKTDPNFSFDQFKNSINGSYFKQNLDPDKTYQASHPPFDQRMKAMETFWNQYAQKARDPLARPVSSRSFAGPASLAYVNLYPDRFYLDLALTGGLTMLAKPNFSVGGQLVSAQLAPPARNNAFNLLLGLSLSRFNWQKLLRWELDALWTRQQYATRVATSLGDRLLETVDLQQVALVPKLTVSTARWAGGFGWVGSVGPSVRLPLDVSYRNYANPSAMAPRLDVSAGLRVSVGAEWLPKTYLPHHWRLLLSYEYVPIGLKSQPTPQAQAHTLDLSLSYTLRRF